MHGDVAKWLRYGPYAPDYCRRRLGSEANELEGVAVDLFGSPASDGKMHMSEYAASQCSTLEPLLVSGPPFVSHITIIQYGVSPPQSPPHQLATCIAVSVMGVSRG
jgi:hypothetical protein